MSEDFVRELLVSPEEAKADIQSCIDALEKSSMDEDALLRWYDDTEKTLEHIFVSGGSNYLFANGGFNLSTNYYTGKRVLHDVNIPRANGILRRLISLVDQHHGASQLDHPIKNSVRPSKENKRVFIVHGHDEAAREKVERLLERFGLEPVVINKKANEGKTILEKIEAHSDVGFAVVLFTPDDIGGSVRDSPPGEKRPRQNVLIELGYFWGKLGRNRVCLLNAIGSAISSDLAGLGYTMLDDRGAWRVELARELKSAGYTIDGNALLDL